MTSKRALRGDLTTAMKAKDKARTRTLRAVLTAVQQLETSGGQQGEASDAQVDDIVVREAKTRRESLEAYRGAGRDDLAATEQEELDVLADYLPQPLDADEIGRLVADTIAELGVADQGMKAMGRVMGALTPQTKGRADGAAVSAEVRRQLAG